MIKESLKSIPNRGYKYAGAGLLSLLSLGACANDNYKVGEADFLVTCPADQPTAIAPRGRFHKAVYVYCYDPNDDPDTFTSKPVSVELLTSDDGARLDVPGENVLNVEYSYLDSERNPLPETVDFTYQKNFHSELTVDGISSVIATRIES